MIPDEPLFDPLLSDEPIDLLAVAADDALLDALASGDHATTAAIADPDDPLPAMLAAWAADARREPLERVRVVLTPPEAWPPRIHPVYRAWLDGPVPTPGADPFVARCVVAVCFLLCALIAVTWWALP